MSDWLTRRLRLQLCQRAVCTSQHSTGHWAGRGLLWPGGSQSLLIKPVLLVYLLPRDNTHRSKVCYIHKHPQVSNRDGQNYPQGYSTQHTHTHTTAHCQSTATTHFNEFLLYNLAHMSSSVCTWGSVSALQIRRVRKLTAELPQTQTLQLFCKRLVLFLLYIWWPVKGFLFFHC